jgi:hypothetical protein
VLWECALQSFWFSMSGVVENMGIQRIPVVCSGHWSWTTHWEEPLFGLKVVGGHGITPTRWWQTQLTMGFLNQNCHRVWETPSLKAKMNVKVA